MPLSVEMHQTAEIRAKHMKEKKMKSIRADDNSSDSEDDTRRAVVLRALSSMVRSGKNYGLCTT